MSNRDGQAPEYPTAEEWAERFSEAVLKPLREVGELLAREVDELNREVAAMRGTLGELGERVDELGRVAGVELGEHSKRVDPPDSGPQWVVVNMEAEPPELLGPYQRREEDTVAYLDREGLSQHAPEDCVLVVHPRNLHAVLAGETSS
jgi:hypothetical protein